VGLRRISTNVIFGETTEVGVVVERGGARGVYRVRPRICIALVGRVGRLACVRWQVSRRAGIHAIGSAGLPNVQDSRPPMPCSWLSASLRPNAELARSAVESNSTYATRLPFAHSCLSPVNNWYDVPWPAGKVKIIGFPFETKPIYKIRFYVSC
jgi:hypothetical protein